MTTKRALIIEDDVNSARVLAHLLSKQNVESTVVIRIDLLEQEIHTEPDIVFIDLEMPKKTGYEVLQDLLRIPHYTEIPIVASSVHIGEINTIRQAGFNSFLGKPLTKDKFPEQLERIFAGDSVWET